MEEDARFCHYNMSCAVLTGTLILFASVDGSNQQDSLRSSYKVTYFLLRILKGFMSDIQRINSNRENLLIDRRGVLIVGNQYDRSSKLIQFSHSRERQSRTGHIWGLAS